MDIVESRWAFMSRPIHGMAAVLHPLYKKLALFMDTSLSTLQTNYINKVFSEEVQLAIDAEFVSYMNSLGPSFVRAVATREEATKFPLTWWQIHGRIGLPKLCRLALRILSQVWPMVDEDKSFTFVLKTPPASILLLKAAGAEKGSNNPQTEKVGKVTVDQVRAIATEKLPDLNCSTIESAMRIIAGTAANMGIDIDPPLLKKKERVVF
ncbi:hypothetical protein L7F22_054276 [Adiantum nelumboides]|nr:hypothetical protein [Adiantum nelumboides]